MLTIEMLKQARILRKNMRLSREELGKLQLRKFRELAAYAYEYSPYYRNVIIKQHIDIEHATPDDFPTLTKTLLLEHFDDIVTDRRIDKKKIADFLSTSKDPNDLLLGTYTVIHTSGSSGTISYYIYSQKELIVGLSPIMRATNTQIFQKLAYIAATKGHFAGITMVSAAHQLPFLYKKIEAYDINTRFTEIIEQLNEMQPTGISGYAFAIRKLAEAQTSGRLHISPKLIESGGEPLSKQDKTYIQETFGTSIINFYAASEFLMMGIGSDRFGGMYLMEDNMIFDIHKECTYVTNLYNYTLPLIRYQMTDRLEEIEDTTHLMPFTKIKEVDGRHEDIPVFLNDANEEDFISPHIIGELYVKNLDQFQLHLVDKKSFTFKACIKPGLSIKEQEETISTIKKTLRAILEEKNMTKVLFDVEKVERLWSDEKTGKFKLITKA